MGYRITPTAIDDYMQKVPRGQLILTRSVIKIRMLNAAKNPSGRSVNHNGVAYIPVVFRNGHDRGYFLVSDQELIAELITAQEYRERF